MKDQAPPKSPSQKIEERQSSQTHYDIPPTSFPFIIEHPQASESPGHDNAGGSPRRPPHCPLPSTAGGSPPGRGHKAEPQARHRQCCQGGTQQLQRGAGQLRANGPAWERRRPGEWANWEETGGTSCQCGLSPLCTFDVIVDRDCVSFLLALLSALHALALHEAAVRHVTVLQTSLEGHSVLCPSSST